jgi:hypothetical protein
MCVLDFYTAQILMSLTVSIECISWLIKETPGMLQVINLHNYIHKCNYTISLDKYVATKV